MTAIPENHSTASPQAPLSLDYDAVAGVRVRPADLARLLGVSRQSVSRWVKAGKVTLGPDGRIDPAAASKQLLRNTDPRRLRVRVLRAAAEEGGGLRDRIAELEKRVAYLDGYASELDRAWEALPSELAARQGDLAACVEPAAFAALVGEIMDRAVLIAGGYDPDEN